MTPTPSLFTVPDAPAAGSDAAVHPTGSPCDWLVERSRDKPTPGAVLFHAPSQVFQAPGGGETQLIETAYHLAANGVPVRPFIRWVDRLEQARLLHLFGLSREGLELARVARSRHVPVVVSPICWYEPRAIAALAGQPVRASWHLARWAAQKTLPRWPRWRRSLLTSADAVLPNSVAEAEQLVRLFAVDPARVRVVPNGVGSQFASASPELWHARFGRGPFVLYAGRIEPRKNILGLVRAAREIGVPLTVIGDAPPGRESYHRRCIDQGAGRVRWLPAVPHSDPLLASAMAASRVVALPSWFETPGLFALEGAIAGAAVVVTPYGCAREYFGDLAEYARPDHPAEVARALERAWRVGPDPRLAPHVGVRFSWSEVARRTARVYDHVAR